MHEQSKARRLFIGSFVAAGHLAVLALLVRAAPDVIAPPQPIIVELVRPIELTAPAEAPAPPEPEPPKPEPPKPEVKVETPKPPVEEPEPPPKRLARPTPTPQPTTVAPLAAREGADTGAETEAAEVSDSQLASATTAESGSAGAGCNMPRRLQVALRKDPQVRAMVAQVNRGRALKVWDGDWVKHPSQEGRGLAAVREVIMWEVAFAPEACRAEPVRGLVLISMNDSPGAARLVVGQARWHWTDLLHATPRG